MAGCGLRVSEACDLTLDGIHWSTDKPYLRFTGKRNKERVVPMNLHVQDTLRHWLDQRGTLPSEYVFCNLRNGQRLSRKTVWHALKRHAQRAGIRHIHPHMLRHAFGTELANRNVRVERICELMGHGSIHTSKIYITVSTEHKRDAVEQIDTRSWLARWWSRQHNRTYRFFSNAHRPVAFATPQTIGRQAELEQLQTHLNKGIDTLLLGSIGIGKSHLLTHLQGASILRLDRLTPIRQAIIDLAEQLHTRGLLQIPSETSQAQTLPAEPGESLSVLAKLTPDSGEQAEATPASRAALGVDFTAIKKQHARTSIQGWVRIVLQSIEPNQWTLIIDDLSELTVSTGRILDQLATRCTIIAALHYIKKPHEKHFWKYERLELAPLPTDDARRLIRQASTGIEIEDQRQFETHLLQKSAGNPRAILESVERLRKEPTVTRQSVRELSHIGGRKQVDLTPVVVIPVLLLVALRFIARGIGDIEFYVLAGVGSALAVGVQYVLFRSRR
jgi:hypothetical protein